jgi:hypothetical protein
MPDATVGIGTTISFTPDGGGGAVTISANMEINPANEPVANCKYPNLGDGIERVAPGAVLARDGSAKVNVTAQDYTALEVLRGVLGTWEVGLPAGVNAFLDGHGFMSDIKVDTITDRGIVSATITWALDGQALG